MTEQILESLNEKLDISNASVIFQQPILRAGWNSLSAVILLESPRARKRRSGENPGPTVKVRSEEDRVLIFFDRVGHGFVTSDDLIKKSFICDSVANDYLFGGIV